MLHYMQVLQNKIYSQENASWQKKNMIGLERNLVGSLSELAMKKQMS